MHRNSPPIRDLVLVGAGHAHVQVVKMLAMSGPPDLRVTLISEGPTAFYSGMLPGCVAGLYTPQDIQIELRPLARWAGARFIEARVTGLDWKAKVVRFEDRPDLAYDVVSINAGSTTRGHDIPGVREHALMTRPINKLLGRLEEFEKNFDAGKRPAVVVVGGGAAGFELACGLHARFNARYGGCQITLVDSSSEILAERGRRTSALGRKTLKEKGITAIVGAEARRAEAHQLELKDGRALPFDLLVWATGGAPAALAASTGLATDAQGFIKVRRTLQSESAPEVFAAGDCVTLEGHPDLPKSGVYAVREGPYLANNIVALLRGEPLENYVPQRGFLALLMTGDRSAIASWKGLAARGNWVWRWKDYIDQRFMDMFVPQFINGPAMHSGAPLEQEPPDPNETVRCAGCGGKVGGTVLSKVLSTLQLRKHERVHVGLDTPDDAAILKIPEGRELVQTVDHFRAFLEDPYLVARIATVHAASDIFAMGGRPDTVLAFATLPRGSDDLVARDLGAVMAGIVHETHALGAALVGGHTDEGDELSVGLVFNGLIDPQKILTKGGLRAGDRLILTKPLGTGTILAAEMRMLPVGTATAAAIASMLKSNSAAVEILIRNGVRALTDVTGFGLAVHLSEMLEASELSASLELAKLPLLPGAQWCFDQGVNSSLHSSNRRHLFHRWTVTGDTQRGAEILYDPQTSGGLIAGVQEPSVKAVLAELHAAGYTDAVDIGEVVAGERTLTIR
jgi:selenide,water dikinase